MANDKTTVSGPEPEEFDVSTDGNPEADDAGYVSADDATDADDPRDGDLVDDLLGGGDVQGEDLTRDLPDPEPYDVADDEDEAEELDDDSDEDPEQTAEAEELAAAAVSTRPVRRVRSSKAPVKKAAPTATRSSSAAVAESRRTTPAQFVRECVAELRKVIWPTGNQLRQYFTVVLIFVLFIIALVGLLDLVFTWLLIKALG